MLIHPPTIDEERPNFPAQFAAVGGTTEVKRAKKVRKGNVRKIGRKLSKLKYSASF